MSAAFLTAATPVLAQVTVDLHALQALPNRAAATNAPRPVPQAAPNTQTVVTRVAPLAAPTPATPPEVSRPALPDSVPKTAAIASIPSSAIAPIPSSAIAPIPSSTIAPESAPPPPLTDKAVTAAAPATTGLRLTFAPGESDLTPDSSASIKKLAEAAPPTDATTFNVLAYAPGKADDPSTARRISLSRAMAVRSALVADGVPSARIFVRALGDQYGDGPPDRVDLSVTGSSTNTATTR